MYSLDSDKTSTIIVSTNYRSVVDL